MIVATRACAEYDRPGNAARTRAAGAGSRRVISTLWAPSLRLRAISMICSGVLPAPKITSGKPGAQGAVVIDLGEAEVVERQGAQLLERGVGTQRAGAHLAQQIFQALGIHTPEVIEATRSSRSARPPRIHEPEAPAGGNRARCR